jgi:RNA exonuclease 4
MEGRKEKKKSPAAPQQSEKPQQQAPSGDLSQDVKGQRFAEMYFVPQQVIPQQVIPQQVMPVPVVLAQYQAPFPVYAVEAQKPGVQPSASVQSIPKSPSGVKEKPYFGIDVECIATGTKHNARAVGHIAVVDQWCRTVLNIYVKPKEKVISYLPALTGLSEELLSKGVSLDTAIKMIKSTLPAESTLVGQNVLKDVEWLGLKEGEDFAGMMDLAGLWRVLHPKYKTYSYFSLHHKVKCLLNVKVPESHNACTDAILSVQLYNLYKQLQYYPALMARAHQLLLDTPVDDSFAKQHPVYEGVCMGQKKTCKCGAPFFY